MKSEPLSVRLGPTAELLIKRASSASLKSRNQIIEECIIKILGVGKKRVEQGEWAHLFKQGK